uniref:ANK_REP_REGION domain-containing protein n=1 Tax=Macrostomum lignano TaxID=282301 RepID=A0A1I8J8D5_9PLAT
AFTEPPQRVMSAADLREDNQGEQINADERSDSGQYVPWPLPEVEVTSSKGDQPSRSRRKKGKPPPTAPGYESPEPLPRSQLEQPEAASAAAMAHRNSSGAVLPPADSANAMPLQMVRFFESTEDNPAAGVEGGYLADEPIEGGRLRLHHASFMDMIEAVKDGRSQQLEEMMGPPQLQNFGGSGGGGGGAGRGRKNVHVDKKDANGCAMLHYAARNNHVGVCEVLLRRGADINIEGPDQMTPLHMAAKYKRTKGAKAAAAAMEKKTGSQTNLRESAEFSVGKEEKDAVYFLLRGGADMTRKDFYGCTPLHYAAMKGNTEAARFLLSFEKRRRSQQRGQEKMDALYSTRVPIWRLTDNENMTPLHLACSHKEAAVVRLLIETESNDRDYLDMTETTGCTALHLACAEGDADICSYLLQAAEAVSSGFRQKYVNKRDLESNICLHYAVENENVEVAEMLIRNGANVNASNTGRETPLHLAARTGNQDLVELLIQNGAKLTARDMDRQTPLHKAARFNQAKLLEYLLSIDSSVIDAVDCDHMTPLLLASCQQDEPTCVKVLLAKGANPFCRDSGERTAVFLAAMWQNANVLKALLENADVKDNRVIDEGDSNSNTPLHIACQNGSLAIVDILLLNKAKYDDKNEDEETPIHLAAKAGHLPIVRRLLRINRTLANDEDDDSNTPLHMAALNGQPKICQLLIEEGKADVEARNSRGWTALDCAASKGFTKVAQVLLDNDSPIDPADKSNVTPLFLACQGGHLEMVDLLLQIGARVDNRIKHSSVNSPLHNCNCLDAAIDNGHKKVAMTLINSDQWKEALRNETIGEKGEKDTPMRKLIRKMPTVAEKVLNRCVENNKQKKSPDDPKYKVVFYYEFMDDMFNSWAPGKLKDMDETSRGSSAGGSNASDTASIADQSAITDAYDPDGKLRSDIKYSAVKGSIKRNHPLVVMVKKKREDLLVHPLVSALLQHKWSCYGRWVYYINLAFYIAYLVSFTVYMLSGKPTYLYYAPYYLAYNVTGWSNNECEQVLKVEPGCTQSANIAVTKWIVLILGCAFLLKEVIQVFTQRLKYVSFENLLDWTIFGLAIITVIDISDCQRVCGVRTYWQWNTGTFGILTSWINLVLFIRKVPRFGIYVVMFTEVLQTFFKFFVVLLLFIIAFGLTFYLILANQVPYDSVAKSLLKTTVMMMGEFEYDAIFNTQYDSNVANAQIFYDPAAYIVFIASLIIMSIVLMNLLVGLAVDDIKSVQNQASLKKLAMQIELVLEVEEFLPFRLIRRFFIKSEAYFPNPDRNDRCYRLKEFFSSRWITRDKLQRALRPELDEWEKIYKKLDQNSLRLITMKGKMKDMRSQISRMDGLLTAIARKMEISSDDQQQMDAPIWKLMKKIWITCLSSELLRARM